MTPRLRQGPRSGIGRPPSRVTNTGLLVVLVAAVGSGALAFGVGRRSGAWVVTTHAVAGLGAVVLTPWKSAIARRGIAKKRAGTRVSIALAVAAITSVASGFLHSSGVLLSLGPITAMQVDQRTR